MSENTEPVPASTSASTPATPASSPAKTFQRQTYWQGVTSSLSHLKKAIDSEGHNLRKSDALSTWLVPCSALALLAATLVHMSVLRTGLVALTFATLMYFLSSRCGVIKSLNFRQTNLVWHLIMSSFVAGITFAYLCLEIAFWRAQLLH